MEPTADMNIVFDYTDLHNYMVEKGISKNRLALAVGMSQPTLSRKLEGRTPFKSPEIVRIQKYLNIDKSKMNDFFYTCIVQKNEPRRKKE